MSTRTIAARLPSWHPTKRQFIALLASLALGAIVMVVLSTTTDVFSRRSTTVQPEQQVQIGPAPAENPSAQTEPEVVAPVAPANVEWPLAQVEWGPKPPEVKVPLMGADLGIYNGSSGFTSAGPERIAMAKRILPGIDEKQTIIFAIARDPQNPEIVLAGITIIYDQELREAIARGENVLGPHPEIKTESRLFLSLDNERSWGEKSVFQDLDGGAHLLHLIAVARAQDSVLLFVGTKLNEWNMATIPLADLP